RLDRLEHPLARDPHQRAPHLELLPVEVVPLEPKGLLRPEPAEEEEVPEEGPLVALGELEEGRGLLRAEGLHLAVVRLRQCHTPQGVHAEVTLADRLLETRVER